MNSENSSPIRSKATLAAWGLLLAAGLGCRVVDRVLDPLTLASSTPPPAVSPIPATAEPTLPPATVAPSAADMARTLETVELPVRDPRDLTRRLRGVDDVPEVVATSAAPIAVGAIQTFFASNVDTNDTFSVEAELRAVTPHVYFWVERDVETDAQDLAALVERFESHTYPTTRAFFGSEWTPGVDGDPHLYILFVRNMGGAAGYYSSVDEYPTVVNEFSNQHEMFYLNADAVDLGLDETDGILAHEFQHMIHWANDMNEDSWVNEGFSELAAYLSGFDPGGFDSLYLSDPDLSLTIWPGSDGDSAPHYGGSFLLLGYFLHRFGEQATQALVDHSANGMASLDAVLDTQGDGITADDVFADWAVANFLGNDPLADEVYTYPILDNAFIDAPVEDIETCPQATRRGQVHQYGVDYWRVTCIGPISVHFGGAAEVPVVPASIRDGQFAFWSNRGDESDMTLTREFDFSSVTGPLQLVYSTWFDIETDYDYLYMEASADGGEHWAILTTPSGTDVDPTGANFGWGYTGRSGGEAAAWIEETVDLSAYAGQPSVLLRFEYVTDAAVNAPGFLLDEVRIPEIDYREDFEGGDGGWEAAGFVRLINRLPQTFRVQAIERGPDGVRVTQVPLDELNSGSYTAELGDGVNELVLVISGVTRVSQQPAAYELSVTA